MHTRPTSPVLCIAVCFRCVVCMCSYETKDLVRSLPCTHDFHRDCIDQWFAVRQNTCVFSMCACILYTVHVYNVHLRKNIAAARVLTLWLSFTRLLFDPHYS